MQASVLYGGALRRFYGGNFFFRHLEFCQINFFANSSYTVHRIRNKIGLDHHYTKLVNLYQNLGKILFPSEPISQSNQVKGAELWKSIAITP